MGLPGDQLGPVHSLARGHRLRLNLCSGFQVYYFWRKSVLLYSRRARAFLSLHLTGGTSTRTYHSKRALFPWSRSQDGRRPSTCVRAFASVPVCVCVCVCVRLPGRVHTHVRVSQCVCVPRCAHLCPCVYTYIGVHVCMCVHMSACVSVRMFACVNIRRCACVWTHVICVCECTCAFGYTCVSLYACVRMRVWV